MSKKFEEEFPGWAIVTDGSSIERWSLLYPHMTVALVEPLGGQMVLTIRTGWAQIVFSYPCCGAPFISQSRLCSACGKSWSIPIGFKSLCAADNTEALANWLSLRLDPFEAQVRAEILSEELQQIFPKLESILNSGNGAMAELFDVYGVNVTPTVNTALDTH